MSGCGVRGWGSVKGTEGERGKHIQSSGAMCGSRWPSLAPVPNKPTVSVDVKQHSSSEENSLSLSLSLSLLRVCVCVCVLSHLFPTAE